MCDGNEHKPCPNLPGTYTHTHAQYAIYHTYTQACINYELYIYIYKLYIYMYTFVYVCVCVRLYVHGFCVSHDDGDPFFTSFLHLLYSFLHLLPSSTSFLCPLLSLLYLLSIQNGRGVASSHPLTRIRRSSSLDTC